MLNDDGALVTAIHILTDRVRARTEPAFAPDQARFWNLHNNIEVLYEAIARR